MTSCAYTILIAIFHARFLHQLKKRDKLMMSCAYTIFITYFTFVSYTN